jgi:hypothetical protein
MASHGCDLGYRQQIRAPSPDLPQIEAIEIEQQDLTVNPIDVPHLPIKQPFGYRVQPRNRKIVFWGDACPNDNIIRTDYLGPLIIGQHLLTL